MKKMNKWFYAFLVVAVILAGVVATLIMIGVNNKTPDPTPDYTEGAETGVYYYDVADGEVVLSLNSGNIFTIAGPGLNKSGTYTVDGEAITLDFVRDEDGTASAVLANGNVTLTYNGATMMFIPKVNYTVSFNTNGGSAVESVSILNGKTVTKPADPTKDSHVFIGWYSDSEFKTPYDFATAAVAQDVTVYARWAEVKVGQNEFLADFDLGYAGAPKLEDMETIGGKLYGVKTPERDGYTFGGWYVSMYEDGEKLSYAYTEDMVLDANTTLFAVWYESTGSKLNAPKVSVSGTSIKWDAVAGANAYKVVIKDANGTVVEPERNVGATTMSYDFGALPAGDYSVEVVAVANNTANNSDAAVRYYKNKALGRVSKFQVVDGVLVFNAVEGAEKYLITVSCGNEGHNHELFDNGNSTNYNFANCSMKQGGITFVVTAVASGYASTPSETYVYNRVLDSVGSVIYDAAKDAFVWNEVAFASKYTVTVVVGDKSYTFDNGTKTSFSVADFTGNVTVNVVPVTEGYNSPEATVATCTKTAPPVPNGITVNGMSLTWNAVEGATSYEIKIGSVTKTVTTNTLDLADPQLGLTVGATYTVQVKAIKGNESSAYSDAVSVGYRVMSSNVTYSDKTVYWTPVAGVEVFEVRVNGGSAVRVEKANFAKVTLMQAGINKIEVRYLDYGGSSWASVEVVAYAVTYNTRSLNGEFTEYLAKGDTMTPPAADVEFSVNGFEFDGWYNSPAAAAGNGKEYTSDVFSGNGDTVLYANWTPKSYKIQFQVDGFDINNIQQGTESEATYTKDYKLPVPVSSNPVYGSFIGWYTGPAGSGEKLTDADGNSVSAFPFYRDTVAYPYFDTGILSFILKSDGTYAVKMGPNFASVANVTVPYTYDGVPVTTILENAFANSKTLVTISIPANIKLVGTGAFAGCKALEAINSYEVEGNYETFYSTSDGALLMHDMGTVYLEVFPRAKTGVYTVPETVDVIRDKAFQYSNIDKVIVSKGVTLVKTNAFYNCKAITAVEFEGDRTSLLTLEDNIFRACPTIKSIKLPAKMAEMNYLEVMTSLTNLESIEVEDGGSYYGSVNGMLTNSIKDTILYVPAATSGELTVPVGIQHIGAYAFSEVRGLTKVVIPTYVMSVGEYAFSNCTALNEVTVNSGRNNDLSIGDYAFAYCPKLKHVTFGENANYVAGNTDKGAISIGAFAFAPALKSVSPELVYDTSLQKVTFSDGVRISVIGESAFANQTVLTNIVGFDDKAVLITEIGASAFENAQKLNHIIIPASTRKIGDSAFAACAYVAKVDFAEGGNSIEFGEGVFADCTRLTEIYLPATVSHFDGTAFAGCPSIEKITVDPTSPYYSNDAKGILYDAAKTELIFYPKTLPVTQEALNELPWNTITKIGDSVFSYNEDLTTFEVKKGVTVIGKAAFAECKNLETLTFEDGGSALVVDDQAFYNCKKITTIALPAYTTEIGESAFENAQFTSFVVPESVISIGYAAFRNANKLESVNIPANVTEICDAAFANCAALTTVTFDNGSPLTIGTLDVEEATDGVFYKTAITALDVKGRAVTIGNYAFYGIKTLATVTFGSGLDTIGKCAFQDTGVTAVTIPNTMTTIGDHAFGGSTAAVPLASIEFEKGGSKALNIGVGAFAYTKITSIEFPNRIDEIYTFVEVNSVQLKDVIALFDGVTTLAEIKVEDGSTKYASIDGVLYEKNERGIITNLLFCPSENVGRLDENGDPTYTIYVPNTVELVENGAFANIHKITTLIFEELDKNDPNYGKPILKLGSCKSDSEWVDLSYDTDPSSSVTAALGGKFAVIGGDQTKGTSGATKGQYLTPTSWKIAKVTNSITNVQFPSHLGYLGAFSITMTKNVMTVTFNPDTTDLTLGRNAFFKAHVEVLELPAVSHVGTYAFYYTGNQTTKTLAALSFAANSTLTTIERYGFCGCYMTAFEIPASIEIIGEGAFSSCSKLANLTFAEDSNVQEIGIKAFDGCKLLTTFDFSNTPKLSYIGNQAFYSAGLTSFEFPDSITSIGSKIFDYCASIEEITLSSKISAAMVEPTGTTESMFSGMKKLKEIKINGNNPELCVVDGVLYDKAMTILYCFPQAKDHTGYTIPATITRLANHALYGYKGTTLELPAGLEYIGVSSIAYTTALKSIVIPASVKEIGQGAFASNTSSPLSVLETVIFEEGSQLKKLGMNCFYYNKSLKTIVLPDGVEEIGAAAFYSCTKLQEMILPASLKAIPDMSSAKYGLFQNCSALKTVVIQQNVESIGSNAFKGVTLIQEIVIPASVTTIGADAFTGITALKTVTFAEGSRLESIGNTAFSGCTALEEIELPATLKTMGTGVFSNDKALKSVKMAGALEALPTQTFSGCIALETVILPEKLGAIDAQAFAEVAGRLGNTPACTSLKEIVIPATVATIGASAFEGCTALETVIFEAGSALESLGTDANVSDNIFAGTNLKKVVLPDNLKFIGAYMFANMEIGDVVLPTTLTTVGDYAFYNCDNITNVALYGNTTYIGEYAFYDCDNLEKAEVSSGLEYFGTLAFGCCEKLAEGFIPDTVTTMNGNPYAGCPLITTFPISSDNQSFYIDANGIVYDSEDKFTLIYCPSTIAGDFVIDADTYELAPGAFSGSQITSITVPNKLSKISDLAFMNCSKLETVTIGDAITSIGSYAFYGCTALKNVNIPASVKEIGEYAFAECSALAMAVVLPDGLNSSTGVLPQYLFANSGITSVVIPASITNIEAEGVFSGCRNLASVTFNGSKLDCEGIGAYFFKDCTALTEVTIPKGAGDIFKTSGDGVFMGCTNLQKVTLYYTEPTTTSNGLSGTVATVVPSTSDMFNGCTALTEVVVYKISLVNKGNIFRPNWVESDPELSGLNHVGDNFFKDCKALTTVSVAAGAKIGSYAFAGCTSMTNLELSGTFTKDATNVFDGWTEAQTLTLKSYTASMLAAIDEAGALKGCNAKVFDSTGAAVVFDPATGVVEAEEADNEEEEEEEGGTTPGAGGLIPFPGL